MLWEELGEGGVVATRRSEHSALAWWGWAWAAGQLRLGRASESRILRS